MAMRADFDVGDLVLVTRPAGRFKGKGDLEECDHPAKPVVVEPTPVSVVREAHAGRPEAWVVVGGRAYPARWAELAEGASPCG